MNTQPNPYNGYHYPAEIISHAVWLYHRFTLSFRDIEDWEYKAVYALASNVLKAAMEIAAITDMPAQQQKSMKESRKK